MTSSEGPLILTVDDNAQVTGLLQSALINACYHAVPALDASDVLRILETTEPDLFSAQGFGFKRSR